MEREVRRERSGWRDDLKLNDWHRKLGLHCPFADVDIIMADSTITQSTWIEFDHEKPKALFEYKRRNVSPNYIPEIEENSSIRTQRNLANMAGIPFFIIAYDDDMHYFCLFPDNKLAVDNIKAMSPNPETYAPKPFYVCTERVFAKFLYRLRGRELPANISHQCWHDN